jgi:hypothetical protein
MDLSLNSSISFDWFILALRIAFIGLIYYFLYQVARVSIRELTAFGLATATSDAPTLPSPASALEVLDPVDSSLRAGDMLPLDHYTTVGRGTQNSMVIDDGFVSTAHAEIVFDQGAWWLVDLHSTNGTRVNDAQVRERSRLHDGDIVQFGRVTLRASI